MGRGHCGVLEVPGGPRVFRGRGGSRGARGPQGSRPGHPGLPETPAHLRRRRDAVRARAPAAASRSAVHPVSRVSQRPRTARAGRGRADGGCGEGPARAPGREPEPRPRARSAALSRDSHGSRPRRAAKLPPAHRRWPREGSAQKPTVLRGPEAPPSLGAPPRPAPPPGNLRRRRGRGRGRIPLLIRPSARALFSSAKWSRARSAGAWRAPARSEAPHACAHVQSSAQGGPRSGQVSRLQ